MHVISCFPNFGSQLMQKMDFSYLRNIWNTAAQPLIENQIIEYFELWLSYQAYFWKKMYIWEGRIGHLFKSNEINWPMKPWTDF